MIEYIYKLIRKFSEIDKINSKIDKLRLNQGKILDKYLKDISLSDLNKLHYGIFSQFNICLPFLF